MRLDIKRIITACVICLLFALNAVAASVSDGNAKKVQFDVNHANKQFDAISLKLSTVNLDPTTLTQAIHSLGELAAMAEECVQQTEDEISDLNLQLKNIGAEEGKVAGRVDSKYLNDQKEQVTKRQAKCRLFLIRANEALEAYKKTLLSLQQEITFTQGKNILERLESFPEEAKKLAFPSFDEKTLKDIAEHVIYAVPLFLLALFLSWRLQCFFKTKFRTYFIPLIFNTILLFSGILLLASLFFMQTPFMKLDDNVIFQNILLFALIFIALLFIYVFLFSLKRFPTLLQWYGFDVVFLKRLSLVILIIYFAHLLGAEILLLAHASKNILQLYEDLILIVSLSAMSYFTLSLYHSHSEWFRQKFSGKLLYQAIGVIVLTLLILDFVGYYILAVDSAYILFSFMLVSALGTVLFLGVSNAYMLLSYNPHYMFYVKRAFGYAHEPPYIEFFILKLIAQLVVIVSMTFLFAQLIGEASYFIDTFLEYLIDGFKVGKFTINPLQWLLGILIFCFLSLLSRHISIKISRSQQFEDDEEEKQVAFASIMLYAGYGVSVIVGLIMAGVSFTSLAIIAGALSVGIGLGLQSIVNNFFSGLILLIEKPIKAGDRIKIDDIEGFVKKVRVRSTQVVTPAQEDIIIPNSDLITHQVVNYMFSDKYWRVKCSVGVAYGSDIDKVKEVMLEVALSHPEVIKRAPNQPLVLFRSFGDSALLFELWCLIKDVNKKYLVASELNFALDKACRKNDITIAFPQQDVHIKFDQKDLPWKK